MGRRCVIVVLRSHNESKPFFGEASLSDYIRDGLGSNVFPITSGRCFFLRNYDLFWRNDRLRQLDFLLDVMVQVPEEMSTAKLIMIGSALNNDCW